MKSIDFVIDQTLPTLEIIEQTRQSYLQKRKQCLTFVVAPCVAIALIAGFALFPFGLIFASVFAIAISSIAYHLMAGKTGKLYAENYKSTIISKLVKTIDNDLNFNQLDGINADLFIHSQLFANHPDRYRTEDLIHGKYGKTPLKLAEVHAEDRQTSTDSNGRTRTTYRDIFKGLILIADFNKNFQGQTFVFPDFAEKTFGNLGRSLQKMGGRRSTSLVQMEDSEFEQAFVVHSTDQIEARYILTPSLMRRILELKHKFGSDVRLVFKDSSVWISVPHSKPYLEPNTQTPATDRNQIKDMLTEVASFIELIEELDLNTRIWTKE